MKTPNKRKQATTRRLARRAENKADTLRRGCWHVETVYGQCEARVWTHGDTSTLVATPGRPWRWSEDWT